MTPFALRLCFRDPSRDGEDYGGERATFVVLAEDLGAALTRWLDRADDKGVTLDIIEEAAPVAGKELAELVTAAKEGGIAAGQSYGYPALEPAKGVFFGLMTGVDGWVEVAAKAADAGAAARALLAAVAETERAVQALEGLCDLTQATEEATFQGQPLYLAALALGMQAPGTVQFGASYEFGVGENG